MNGEVRGFGHRTDSHSVMWDAIAVNPITPSQAILGTRPPVHGAYELHINDGANE